MDSGEPVPQATRRLPTDAQIWGPGALEGCQGACWRLAEPQPQSREGEESHRALALAQWYEVQWGQLVPPDSPGTAQHWTLAQGGVPLAPRTILCQRRETMP